MPMIEIKGLEHDTPQSALEALQEQVEAALAHGLEIDERMCHSDPIVSPVKRKRPKVLIWGHITTAFFQDKPEDEDSERRVKAATKATAEKIWEILEGRFTVEIFPPPYMNQMKLKTLVKKRTD